MERKLKKPTQNSKLWQFIHTRNQYRRKKRPKCFNLNSHLTTNTSHSKAPISQPLAHSRYVEIWQGAEYEKALSKHAPHIPPNELCLEKNTIDTVQYLEAVRRHGNRTINHRINYVKRKKGRLPRIKSYTDFSKLKGISTAAAVVLTAEYDRIAQFRNEIPPTVNLKEWNDAVFLKLYQLGFFELLGHASPKKDNLVKDGDFKTMQIIRAMNNDDLERVDNSLTELGNFLSIPDEVVIQLITALSEAISNMIHHAYPVDMPLSYPFLNSLWVSATANRKNNTLTVVAYDQGASIPVTYPRINRIEKVGRYLGRVLIRQTAFDYQNDDKYIRAAMKYGGSRTDEAHRGKGLPQMLETIKHIGSGRMKVYSRGGWCEKSASGKLSSGSHQHSIGGTLIEWSLELSNVKTVVEV